MRFNEKIDTLFNLLDPNICRYHSAHEDFCVSEREPDGHAEITVSCNSSCCFHVQNIDKKTFPVLSSQKCADDLVFVFDQTSQKWILHIFEMTRSISASTWETKILPQLEGGLMNAYAILGILQSGDFNEIHVHCCYRNNRSESSPVELRAALGKPVQPDWLNDPVKFSKFPEKIAVNKPVRLDKDSGTGQLNL